jgi:hypothetical protein
MSAGLLPASLLCAACGLALARAPRDVAIPSLLALAAAAIAATGFAAPAWQKSTALAGWIVTAATAAIVHRCSRLSLSAAIALAALAGACCGAMTGMRLALLPALLCAPAALFAARMSARRVPFVLDIAASWLIAVALLAVVLALLPVTPGNLPDHLE